ncbi:MAG TPA: SpoIIE family protein phosphatase, partial [Pseudonocardia sp.]
MGRLSTREVEPEFRALADATPALIWVDDAERGRTLVNRAWREFTGAAPSDDLGESWPARVHPGDVERCTLVRTAAVAAGEPFELEYRLRRADGRYCWVVDRGAPFGDAGTYVGGCLDIDDRHRERERRRLLDTIGSAMDAETTVPGRRDVLVRALVDEGLADMARLVDVALGAPRTVAVAAANAEDEQVIRELNVPWGLDRGLLTTGVAQLFVVDDGYLALSTADEGQRGARRGLDMNTVVVVPLRARGRVVGVLATARSGTSPPQEDADAALLGEICQRAAIALDNAALLAAEQATTRRLELLQRATAALSSSASPRAVARTTVRQLGELLGTAAIGVWGRRDDTLVLLDGEGWQPTVHDEWARMPLSGRNPISDTARDGASRWLQTTQDWMRGYSESYAELAAAGYPSLLTLPLIVGDDRIGAIAVGLETDGMPADNLAADDRSVALALADQCANALQRAGLLAAESLARRTAEGLSDIVSALSGATTPSQVAAVIARDALALGAAEAVVVVRTGEQLEVLAGPPGKIRLNSRHPLAAAVRTGHPAWPGRSGGAVGGLPCDAVVPLLLEGRAIGAIGLAFSAEAPQMGPSQRAIILTVAGQCAQALDRARLHAVEHEVADILQRSLLPRELPRLARLAAAPRYLPGSADTQAGGDWYELIPVDDHRVALAVGDVVGHGPAAAAVMGQLRSALASYLLDGHGPAAALERLDRFAARIPGAQGSTCVCLTLDWLTGELRFARAGHLPVLLVGPDGAEYSEEGAGTVLAVLGRPPFVEGTATIAPGTSVLLYTDGLVERRGEVIDEGLARLATAAATYRDADPDTLADGVVSDVLGDAPPYDDVALVVVRLMPAPLAVTLPAAPESLRALRRSIAAWAGTAGLPEAVVDDLQLAVGEAAANAAEHAYPAAGEDATFDCALRRIASGDIDVRVRDRGHWRPARPDPGFRGRGLQVIRALGRDVRLRADPGGTEVLFRLPVGPRSAPAAPQPVPGLDADAPVVAVTGDLDRTTVDEVRARLLAAIEPGGRVVVDLREVHHLSSAGLRLLVEVADRATNL